ncbi:hypothetical protein ACFE04_029930 [Oxalis oulophora]
MKSFLRVLHSSNHNGKVSITSSLHVNNIKTLYLLLSVQNMKSTRKLRAGVKRLKLDAINIKGDQRCIREEQKEMRKKLDQIKNDCGIIKQEGEKITQLSKRTQGRLDRIFLIFYARRNKDFIKANN